jgi:beta-lactamase class D
MSVHDPVRAQRRFLPASTFKIPHALIALDEGVVRDEHETFAWDGKKRSIEAWNQSQTLAQAMKHSTVWVFQEIARRLGETREQAWFDKLNYGNRDMSGGLTQFWLDGGLRISAAEQIAFLSQLRALKLPASERSQRIVRHITLIEAARDYAVFGKTGWAQPEGAAKGLGWLVGWVDREDRHAVFALNMEMSAMRDAPKRLAITRDILRADGWLAAG